MVPRASERAFVGRILLAPTKREMAEAQAAVETARESPFLSRGVRPEATRAGARDRTVRTVPSARLDGAGTMDVHGLVCGMRE
jgi:hypothetical protein